MPGYTILFSSSKTDKTSQIISKDSPKIKEINSILAEQFKDPRYGCHLDHLMLFSVMFFNMDKRIYYNGLYIISLVEIDHPLFITNGSLEKLLNSTHTIRANDIYCSYPSFRFNKFHIGDYFYLDDSDKIVIRMPQTNSNGLVRN